MKPKEIKQLRKDKGWTQVELSEKVGAALDTVKSWESGRRNPNQQAKKLLKILKNI